MKAERSRLLRFYLWVTKPRGLAGLKIVLNQLRDVELLHIMGETNNREAMTIAWAEYGRRHKAADIEFEMLSRDALTVRVRNVTFGASLGLA